MSIFDKIFVKAKRKSKGNTDERADRRSSKAEKKEKYMKDEETKVGEQVDTTVEDKKVEDAKETGVDAEAKETVETKKTEEETKAEEPPVVTETEPMGNGIPLEALATKDDVRQMFEAFEAKYAAIVKENEDLKQKFAESESEKNAMHEKYEVGDFGSMSKPAASQLRQTDTYETYEQYVAKYQ